MIICFIGYSISYFKVTASISAFRTRYSEGRTQCSDTKKPLFNGAAFSKFICV